MAAIAAPVVTAVGAIAALAKEWTIEVDHLATSEKAETKPDEGTAD